MSGADGVVGDVVVVAMDGSDQAEDALNWYITHLHKPKNTVLLVHSMDLPSMPTRESWEAQTSSGKAKRQEIQDRYTRKFTEHNISGKFISDFEKPGEFICRTAEKEKANYVVMGTRGLGKIRRTIMGSVSDFVVHHANCPVIVCRK